MKLAAFIVVAALPAAILGWMLGVGRAVPSGEIGPPLARPARVAADAAPVPRPDAAPAPPDAAPPAAGADAAPRPAPVRAATTAAALAHPPPGIVAGPVESFAGDRLYERIDGAAPLFLERGFRVLLAVDLRAGEAEISVEVYEMSSAAGAQAVVAEAAAGARPLAGFPGAVRAPQLLAFTRGARFVKLVAFDERGEAELERVARALAETLP